VRGLAYVRTGLCEDWGYVLCKDWGYVRTGFCETLHEDWGYVRTWFVRGLGCGCARTGLCDDWVTVFRGLGLCEDLVCSKTGFM
jgi:hypothetical protein